MLGDRFYRVDEILLIRYLCNRHANLIGKLNFPLLHCFVFIRISFSAIPRRAAAAGAFRLTVRLEWPLFRRKPAGTEPRTSAGKKRGAFGPSHIACYRLCACQITTMPQPGHRWKPLRRGRPTCRLSQHEMSVLSVHQVAAEVGDIEPDGRT